MRIPRSPTLRALPRLNNRAILALRELRTYHQATANALRLISVTIGAARPVKSLAEAFHTIRTRHSTADFQWRIHRLPAHPRATDFDAALAAIARANVYLVSAESLTAAHLRLLCNAMAIGLPVISPAPPATLPHFITSGVEGMLADYARPADLAAKLSRVLFDIDLRMRMSHAGKRVLAR